MALAITSNVQCTLLHECVHKSWIKHVSRIIVIMGLRRREMKWGWGRGVWKINASELLYAEDFVIVTRRCSTALNSWGTKASALYSLSFMFPRGVPRKLEKRTKTKKACSRESTEWINEWINFILRWKWIRHGVFLYPSLYHKGPILLILHVHVDFKRTQKYIRYQSIHLFRQMVVGRRKRTPTRKLYFTRIVV